MPYKLKSVTVINEAHQDMHVTISDIIAVLFTIAILCLWAIYPI